MPIKGYKSLTIKDSVLRRIQAWVELGLLKSQAELVEMAVSAVDRVDQAQLNLRELSDLRTKYNQVLDEKRKALKEKFTDEIALELQARKEALLSKLEQIEAK